ncbi:MAG: ABC transporter permease [Chlamydiae bacterium]|nr:ABC transporter permease [Chlamydiota bacterium]
MKTLIWREFVSVLIDKKIRISLLLPPVIQLFVFTYAATLDVKNIKMGILNQDGGKQSIELIQRIQGSPYFSDIIALKGVQEITHFMDSQKGMLVLQIDQDFSRKIERKEPLEVMIILDGRKSNSNQIVAGYISDIVANYNLEFSKQKIEIIPRVWFNPNSLYYWYNIPCLVAVLSMLICLIITTQSVARERELGTFDQLLVSPLTSREILFGKMVPGIVIGIFEGMLMLLVGTTILGVPFTGSLCLYVLSLFFFVVAVSGVGLFISSLCYTQQQAMLGNFVFVMPAVLLSGYATPIENMPGWLQPITYVNPLTYMLIISKGIVLKAMPWQIVLENLWPLIPIGMFTITSAGILFRKKSV